MNTLSNTAESYSYGPNQDSYIAITEEGIVADQCPADADLIPWMANYPDHHFLITSTSQAISMLGKPLLDGDVDVVLL